MCPLVRSLAYCKFAVPQLFSLSPSHFVLLHLTQLSLHTPNPPTTHTHQHTHFFIQLQSPPFFLCHILSLALPAEINVMRMLKSLFAIPLKNSEPVKTNSSIQQEIRDLVIIPDIKATEGTETWHILLCGIQWRVEVPGIVRAVLQLMK